MRRRRSASDTPRSASLQPRVPPVEGNDIRLRAPALRRDRSAFALWRFGEKGPACVRGGVYAGSASRHPAYGIRKVRLKPDATYFELRGVQRSSRSSRSPGMMATPLVVATPI